MADSRAGVCYIWLISSLLFIFTVAGGVFLVLYMVQPTYTTTSWYPIIGVSLVCFPWFFWLLTILYRIVSRACGFRMSCFNPSVSDHPVNNIPSGGSARNSFGGGGGGSGVPIQNVSVVITNGIDGGGNGGSGGNLVNENENGNRNVNGNRAAGVGSPKRVHFGGVVVLGEDDGSANENPGRSESLPSPSLSSSSSDDGDESEMPLKLSMA